MRDRHAQTRTDTHTHTDTQTQTDRQTDRHTHTHTHTKTRTETFAIFFEAVMSINNVICFVATVHLFLLLKRGHRDKRQRRGLGEQMQTVLFTSTCPSCPSSPTFSGTCQPWCQRLPQTGPPAHSKTRPQCTRLVSLHRQTAKSTDHSDRFPQTPLTAGL